MHAFKFSVSLRVFSQVVDPDEISVQLGMKPRWKNIMGEPRTNPKGIPLGGVYDSNYCSYSLSPQNEEELHEILDKTVDCLLKHKDLFNKIHNCGGRSEFFIGWYSIGNTGDTFSSTLLYKLGEMKIDLALDVYGESNVEQEDLEG